MRKTPFIHNGVEITDSTLDETGRESVSADYYGTTEADAREDVYSYQDGVSKSTSELLIEDGIEFIEEEEKTERLKKLSKMEEEYSKLDKRVRNDLEAFATRWCLSVAECGAWSDEAQDVVSMRKLSMSELQFHIKVIEMDVYLDRSYDAINSI